MERCRRPGICQVGRVHDDGSTVTVGGWGLTSCATGCTCHLSPETGEMRVLEDAAAGTLGLVKHRPGCGCCEPWHAEELLFILRDLAAVAALPETTEGVPPCGAC